MEQLLQVFYLKKEYKHKYNYNCHLSYDMKVAIQTVG